MNESILRAALGKYDLCITFTASLKLLQVTRPSAHVMHRLSDRDQIT